MNRENPSTTSAGEESRAWLIYYRRMLKVCNLFLFHFYHIITYGVSLHLNKINCLSAIKLVISGAIEISIFSLIPSQSLEKPLHYGSTIAEWKIKWKLIAWCMKDAIFIIVFYTSTGVRVESRAKWKFIINCTHIDCCNAGGVYITHRH